MIEVRAVLNRLALERPVFHSEADFQHALAWAIHTAYPESRLRLEYPLIMGSAESVDVVCFIGDEMLAIELKYWTRRLRCEVEGETFSLKNQGAQDISRYDAVKDICRLEKVARDRPETGALAIWLTNDSSYWSVPRRADTNDADFRIHEGAPLSGGRDWGPNTGAGTKKNREIALELGGTYTVHWVDFSGPSTDRYGVFRSAVIQVAPVMR